MERSPALAETHTAIVVFIGDRAYKLCKPVDLGFLDYSSREQRREALERELTVNRRFAPDVYLGILDLVGPDGTVRDHLLEMQRMPDDRRLATILDTPEAADCVRAVARLLAAAHASAPRSPEITALGSHEALVGKWETDLAQTSTFVGRFLDRSVFDRVSWLATRYVAGRRPLLEQRQRDHLVVDGHGDLLSEDVFCLPDGPRVLDALAFDRALRCGDVLADVGFLAMDLERLGHPELAAAFVRDYDEFTNEHHPASLAHHFIAQRAFIRAKVGCVRAEQGDAAAAAAAPALLDLAERHLETGRVRLVLVGGPPGTGKSTLAAGLADRVGLVLLRSDEMRKERLGLVPTEHAAAPWAEGIYTTESTEATYRDLLERAEHLLGLGESVVLDASWADPAHRQKARAVAGRAVADLVELECVAPPDVTRQRVLTRLAEGHDASDADEVIARHLAAIYPPWPEAEQLDTRPPAEEVLRIALALAGI